MKNKTSNKILAANNGLHSERALETAHEILKYNDLRQPVLYHLVFTGSESFAVYQATIKALVRRLRLYGCRTEYFGAFENEPLKGLHAHCFFLIETSKKMPGKIMNINDGEYLHKLIASKAVLKANNGQPLNRVHIAKPKNPMHGGSFFARPVDDKLENCLEWCSYIYKLRSKHGVDRRETYFNSEFKANKTIRAAEIAALTAAPSTNNDKGNEMTTTLTPAGHRYIAGIYEGYVDRGMDVGQIRAALAGSGITRTPGQVEYDLEQRYGFTGYCVCHPAPAPLTFAQIDEAEEIKVAKTRRVHVRGATRQQAAG